MPSTPDQRRNLLYYFMAGDPKGKGNYQGQMKVWIAYLYNIPIDAIPDIVEKYIKTHTTVDRAIMKTGGDKGLVHKLFYNPEFFQRLNPDGKTAFLELTVDDVLAVLKRFCRLAHCTVCGTEFSDITALKSKGSVFFCSKCRGVAESDFPKLIAIAKVVDRNREWFQSNLSSLLDRLRVTYLN